MSKKLSAKSAAATKAYEKKVAKAHEKKHEKLRLKLVDNMAKKLRLLTLPDLFAISVHDINPVILDSNAGTSKKFAKLENDQKKITKSYSELMQKLADSVKAKDELPTEEVNAVEAAEENENTTLVKNPSQKLGKKLAKMEKEFSSKVAKTVRKHSKRSTKAALNENRV